MEFQGKTTLVTGSATGIGRSLAVALAREGADLALLDIDEERGRETAELVRKEGRRAEFYRADASQRGSLEEAIAAAWSAQGPIALACANAGVGATAPLVEMEENDLDWVLRVNLLGALDTVRAYVKHVRDAKSGGYVMVTGSENSVGLPPFLRRAGLGFYGMTKHAVLHMADTLRYELAGDDIGVSVLMPGRVESEIGKASRKRPEHLGGGSEPAAFDASMIEPGATVQPQISADAAARIAVEGLRADRFMIPTHSHLIEFAKARLDELTEATRATRFEPGT